MYIAPRQGHTTYWDKLLMSTESPYHFAHSLQVLKKKSGFIHIFNDFIYEYSPGAKADNPLGTNIWCQQKALMTLPICCRFKKIALKSDFIYIFFMFHHYVYSPRQGQTIHWRQNVDDNRKALSLCPYVASFKMISSKSDLYTFLMILYMFIAPGQGQKTPWGQTFDVNRKPLSLRPFVASFKQNPFKFWFYTHFLMFFNMYIAPGQQQTTLCGQNPMSTEKPSHFAHLLQVSKKISLKSDFIHNFSCFYTWLFVYSHGAGADNHLRSEFLYKHKPFVTLVICCKFLPLRLKKKKVLDSQATFCINRWGRQVFFFFISPQNKWGNFFFLPHQIWP